jgi:iron(III) transport system substrate-binding protein
MKIYKYSALALFTALSVSSASAQGAFVPEGYPESYAEIAEAGAAEGNVLVYGNLPAPVWVPVIEEFQRRYPTITVETLDLGDELYERYLAESATGVPTADIILSSGIGKWLEFSGRGEMVEYETPEGDMIPDWARPLPGVYVISADPYLMAYNTTLLPEGAEPPTSMADVTALVEEFPEEMNGRLSTFDASRGATGQAIFYAWIREHGDAGWDMLDIVGPATRPETGVGIMMDKLLAGEYAVGYFASASGVIRILGAPGADQISGYGLIEDGTPIMMRGAGITRAASNPNAARLFLDFMLSRDGQLLFSEANLTPYREDIAPSEVTHYTFGGIAEEIGAENINLVEYDQAMLDEYDTFVARWLQSIRSGQ